MKIYRFNQNKYVDESVCVKLSARGFVLVKALSYHIDEIDPFSFNYEFDCTVFRKAKTVF